MKTYRVIDPIEEYHGMILMNHKILEVYGIKMVSWYGMRHDRQRTMTQPEALDLGRESALIANKMIRKIMEVNHE